ncbi:hypothetical protein [Neisseria shayeganii]|uniref:Uncharacterized protein n=1 Tax=Neisseria shayeganii TaxID=607712 RepID=A0A7D7NAP8_9NEIS|nr:hypothetical protein [Neisseria shayeganii]QMT39975.1 hypothetical protein H3L94_08955 [Neisseria shayeganii]
MAKITIIIEDKPDGAAVDFEGDLPEQGARNLTAAQHTAVLLSKAVMAAQLLASPPPKKH